ncbi:MAG: HD domain-containing phosphohydrolase [Planctomycetaceae bacterium]|nr:hypothetical protein [Planctomycetaceae bacterium]
MSFSIIPLKELRQDAVLPVSIFDGQNSTLMLLNRGMVLSQENLQTLQRRGVTHVAIDSRFVKDVWATPGSGRTGIRLQQHFLAEQRKKEELKTKSLTTRLVKPPQPNYDNTQLSKLAARKSEHERCLEEFLGAMGTSKIVRSDVVKRVALESIEDLLQDLDLFVKTTLEVGDSEQSHQHCLRVAKLAMSVATIMENREEDVRHIGIGCLLSRVGISDTVKEIIENPRELTPLELLEVKKNPGRTWNALERITDLPVGARQVAWQINERWNGSGYPRGRSLKQIHPLARIASVADVYIALTSDRPHRPAYSQHEAIRILLADAQRGLFEPVAIRGLLQTVSLFPLGSIVELSNGSLAITVRNNPQQYDCPLVKVVCDSNGHPLPESYIDLAETKSIHVVQTHGEHVLRQRIAQWSEQQQDLDSFFEEADSLFAQPKPAWAHEASLPH